MKRAHRIALKPTPEQEALFLQHAGYARSLAGNPDSPQADVFLTSIIDEIVGFATYYIHYHAILAFNTSASPSAKPGQWLSGQTSRFAYNWAVGEFKAGLDVGEWLSDRTLRPRWNRVRPMSAPCASVPSRRTPPSTPSSTSAKAAASWGAYRKRLKAGQHPGRRTSDSRGSSGDAMSRASAPTTALTPSGRTAGRFYSPRSVGSPWWRTSGSRDPSGRSRSTGP